MLRATLAFLTAVFVGVTALAGALGAANLGTAATFGQIAFVLAVGRDHPRMSRLSIVTLGVADVAAARAFYVEGWVGSRRSSSPARSASSRSRTASC